jgi:N-methylhydantoinase A/oxoprolinase/acetone carboxylase beta subunit
VATNALLERRGARVALVTGAGLEDVIEIARQDRPSLYDPFADRPEPLVDRELRFGVAGRLAEDGSELAPLELGDLLPLPAGVEAVAVCLLHSDRNPVPERRLGEALAAAGHDVSLSVDVSPEFREYERTLTTVINAYLRPACRDYLRRLAGLASSVAVMTSAAGLVPVLEGAELPASLLLSGPAGGVRAAAEVALANGYPDAVTFDMGGTSTDVCLVRGGAPEPAPGRVIGGFPVRLPSLDIHTIGAGGGSLARLDPGGALVVGPESAGADPGPACYNRGGSQPTVTDTDLVLGRIPAGSSFPGLGVLSVDAARTALAAAGVSAEGVVAVVDAAMERALRAVSVERGVEPRGLALVAFGGAGPLHACALADALGMAAVIVPARAGVLSAAGLLTASLHACALADALGMAAVIVPARAGVLSAAGLLTAPVQRELVRSWPTPSSVAGLADARAALAAEAVALVDPGPAAAEEGESSDRSESPAARSAGAPGVGGGAVTVAEALDCRYAGQSHELTVPSVAAFHAEHGRRNGYSRPEAPVEVVALRARAAVAASVSVTDLPPLPERSGGVGPLVLAEADCTIWVPPGWRADPGAIGALVLRRVAGG